MGTTCRLFKKLWCLVLEFQMQTIVPSASLITGYDQQGLTEEALGNFEWVQSNGFHPDNGTSVCNLQVCGSIGVLDKSQEMHAQPLRHQSTQKHGNNTKAIVSVYTKCRALEKSHEVVGSLQSGDGILWNAIITAYVQLGHGKEALDSFEQMKNGGFTANLETFVCLLKACSGIGDAVRGQEIHAQICKERLPQTNIDIWNAVIDMYAKCDALEKAQDVFDDLPIKNLESWKVLISGYAHFGYDEEVLTCFEQMQLRGFSPDAVVLSFGLKSCAIIGATWKGQAIHADAVKRGILGDDPVLSIPLLGMYANVGLLREAHQVFDELPLQNVLSWTVLMAGYARFEKDDIVLDIFDKMLAEGPEPEARTFELALSSCHRSGHLDQSLEYLRMARECYGINLTLDENENYISL